MPARILDAEREVEHDLGEQVLRDCEDASGERPRGCPWWSMHDPMVVETMRAHRWWIKGELGTKYPLGIPAWLEWSVETYDAALNAVQVHDMREEREEREREAKQRALDRETQARVSGRR